MKKHELEDLREENGTLRVWYRYERATRSPISERGDSPPRMEW